jgi:very-short-patch-repair endonuclease
LTPQPLKQEPQGELQCPRCGDSTIEGGEDVDVFVHPDRDDYEPGNPLGARGGYTVITTACCGLRLALVSGNHKGAFYLRLYSVTPAEPSFESPVEKLFWEACRDSWPYYRFDDLVPQHPVNAGGNQFYLDFALLDQDRPDCHIGFEIDGHATHSSPQAIARDRQRQRLLEQAGWKIIRFGGSEVYHDAGRCAAEALGHAEAFRRPLQLPSTLTPTAVKRQDPWATTADDDPDGRPIGEVPPW